MSAPRLGACPTTSASGFEDGFGRRQFEIVREDGDMLERLHLRPAFSIYEQALREATSRVAASAGASAGGRIVAPRTIERDAATGRLVAVSPFVEGERLADLLDAAAERSRDADAVPGIDVALGFLLQVLPTLGALRAATGMSHGAIAPARCVFTADGRVVLTESGFATVLERLNPGRRRLWREFRVAMPPAAACARFDEAGDISQAALAAVMLVLGRAPADEEIVDVLPEWLAEAIEIAQIRGNVSFAVNFQRFLQRALPLPGARPYQTLDAALHDVRPLADTIGIDLCRASIAECVRHAVAARDQQSNVPASLPPAARQARKEGRAEATPPRVVEEPALVLPEEPPRDRVPTKPGFESFYDEVAATPPMPLAVAGPVGGSEPIHADAFVERMPSPVAAEEPPEVATAETPAESVPLEPVTPEPAPPSMGVVDPLDPAAVARRRRSRSKARWMDTLRSAVSRPAPPEVPDLGSTADPAEELTFTLGAEPVVVFPPGAPAIPAPAASSAVISEQPAPPPAAQPVFAPSIAPPAAAVPAVPVPLAPEPVVRQPVFAPLAASFADRIWEPQQPVAPPPIVPAPAPVAAVPRAGPIRLKTSEHIATVRPAGPFESRDLARRYPSPRAKAAPSERRSSWKLAAAAAIVLASIATAARVYLLHDPPLNAEMKDAGPATVSAPPPVTTGTIVAQTQPEGARVLLDGSPAGETPLRIVDVAPGRHVLTFVTPTATVKRTVRVEANRTVTLDVPVFSGWVAIFAPVVLTVSEQGRTIGTTDQGRLLLPPGRHTLTLANPEFGYSADHIVEIEPGEVRSVNITPTGTLNLNAVPWAEVWVDGKKVGDTPVANLTLPLGSREITFTHPELGERKVVTRVTAGEPIAVSVEFNR